MALRDADRKEFDNKRFIVEGVVYTFGGLFLSMGHPKNKKLYGN
jgi:hypothetical protein